MNLYHKQGADKSPAGPKMFCSFLSNRRKFESEILPTYSIILYASLAYSVLKLSALLWCHLVILSGSKTSKHHTVKLRRSSQVVGNIRTTRRRSFMDQFD